MVLKLVLVSSNLVLKLAKSWLNIPIIIFNSLPL
jgi:hypothetical protein